ncbi:MAG: NAD(P)H-dependent oxidoreductase subunit E [Phycisphaerales bacterium]|nr:NAD(P)H-dependent oxidoreductase subunit E [Phycisphaerales bacterium]
MSVDPASPPDSKVVDRQEILQILADHGHDRGGLIAILEEIQSRYGYLSEEALRIVSAQTGRSLVDVYGIATFYRAFSLVPRGKHLVCACLGTACHVRGAPRVVDELERQLGIQAGGTTPDGEFTLETVNCLGACALGPVVVIDGRYFSKVGISKIRQLLDQASAGFSKTTSAEDDGAFPILVSCPRCNHSLMDGDHPVNGLPSVRMILAVGDAVGTCHCSSVYGAADMASEITIPEGSVYALFCPRCHGDLAGDWSCDDCGAPMATLAVHGGGMVNVCRRRGCPGRRLDLECING